MPDMPNTHQNMKTLKKITQQILLLFAVTTTAYSQPTDNVVAYYPFNGNATDVTVNGKNGTVSGATLATDRLGKVNAAYSFNGTSNLIYLPNNLVPGNTAFSISFWFKSYGVGNYNGQALIDFRGQYNFSVSYFSNHPTYQRAILYNIANSSASIYCMSPNNTIRDSAWYHVVANYGNNTMQLYINGNLVDTKSQTPPNAVSGYNNAIGKDYNMSLNRAWFYGSIDEILIYKRSLTAAEISALYNRGLTTSDIPELFAPVAIQYSYNTSGERMSRKIQQITLKSANIMMRDSALINEAINNQNEMYEDNADGQKVIIYPNPTKGQLKIEIQGNEKVTNTVIYLYDLSGKLLINKKQFDSNIPLDLSKYSPGGYILKIIMGTKTSEWKIVKE
jgi:Concanavalin A-like lectin/glucanases superfamily/Secretion system C-terminal sorting domain